jgi:hypothetical protein
VAIGTLTLRWILVAAMLGKSPDIVRDGGRIRWERNTGG